MSAFLDHLAPCRPPFERPRVKREYATEQRAALHLNHTALRCSSHEQEHPATKIRTLFQATRATHRVGMIKTTPYAERQASAWLANRALSDGPAVRLSAAVPQELQPSPLALETSVPLASACASSRTEEHLGSDWRWLKARRSVRGVERVLLRPFIGNAGCCCCTVCRLRGSHINQLRFCRQGTCCCPQKHHSRFTCMV